MLGLMLVILILLYPTGTLSVFLEPLHSASEYAGLDVEFQCHYDQLDHYGWRLNGTFLSMLTSNITRDHCNFTALTYTLTLSNNTEQLVGILRIRAAIECNGTQVECVVFDDQGTIKDYSDNATLTVRRPDAVKNLTVSVDNNTLSIAVSWNPIPDPIDRMPLIAQMFIRITYQVIITQSDDFRSIVSSSETNDTRFTFTPSDPSPCYYYNISVISIINFKYSGIKVLRKQIYLYQNLPSIISVLDYNSTVIEPHKIQYTFFLSVSLHVCFATLILHYQGKNYSIDPVVLLEEFPGKVNGITFIVNQTLLDKKYDNVTISIGNALRTVSVQTPSLSTYDVQDVTAHNGSLTVTFLNGSTAKGALIILAISETMAPNFTFEYVSVEKSPSINTVTVEFTTLFCTIADCATESNSSLFTVLVYDIESTGLLKDSMHLMPVEILKMLNASSLLTESDNGNHNHNEMNAKSDPDWGSVHVSLTSNSIIIVCEIFKPAINGCSAIVHDQLRNPQEFILSVKNSDNGSIKHILEFELEIQNRGNLYNYAVFPITSKGIIGSSAIKGSIHNTDSDTTENTPKDIITIAISLPIVIIVVLVTVAIVIMLIYKYRRKNRGAHIIPVENNNEKHLVHVMNVMTVEDID